MVALGAGAGALVTWILLTWSSGSGSGILGLALALLRTSRLGAEVTLVTGAAMVTGRGAGGPLLSLSSGPGAELSSSLSKLFLDFLLLSVDTPESLELSVEDGKSELVSRKPGQISLTLM